MRKLLLPLLVLACLAVPATASAGPVGGLQIASAGSSSGEIQTGLDTAQAMGAKIVRTQLTWNEAEPSRGQFDAGSFSALDAIVAGASQRGMKVIVTVVGTPCWASSSPDKGGCTATSTPESVARWQPTNGGDVAGIFTEVARRYGTKLDGIEVWNEPDQANELYFRGPDKSTKYVQVLQTAYRAIKAVDPGIRVLGAGIVGFNGVFLQNMYNKGAKGYFDALDVHYYDLVLNSLRTIRKVMKKNGDSSPVVLGEFGFDSCRPATRQGPHVCLTKTQQARALSDVLTAIRRTSWLQSAVIYSLRDQVGGFSFGMLTANGKRKPAFLSARKALQGRTKQRKIRVKLRKSGNRTRVTVSGPYADIYTLTVRKAGQLRYKATFRLGRNATFTTRLPSVLGTRGLTVRATFPWNGKSASAHR